jgi:hypothetical protein
MSAAAGGQVHYKQTDSAAHNMYTNENEATVKDVKARFQLTKNPSKYGKSIFLLLKSERKSVYTGPSTIGFQSLSTTGPVVFL